MYTIFIKKSHLLPAISLTVGFLHYSGAALRDWFLCTCGNFVVPPPQGCSVDLPSDNRICVFSLAVRFIIIGCCSLLSWQHETFNEL